MLNDLHRNKKKIKNSLDEVDFFPKKFGHARLRINRLSQCGKCMDNYLIQAD